MGRDHFAASLQALGVPAPHLMAWATIGLELVGGLAVLCADIPLIALPLTVILLVAAITVHLPYGFSSIKLRAVTAAALNSVLRGMRHACCTSLCWPHSSSADPVPSPSMRGFRVAGAAGGEDT